MSEYVFMTADNSRTLIQELLKFGMNEVQIAGAIGVTPKTVERIRDGFTMRMHRNNKIQLDRLFADKFHSERKAALG